MLYRITDLFGGFYYPGRDGYGPGYVCPGVIAFDGISSFSMIEGTTDPWGYGWIKTEGTYNSGTGNISLDNYWNTSGYVFHLFLE
ncbi:MAG: DUF5012 domain-containing protein [Prevotellaceae bacterium]|nr:DUF5012 domain-containing protein [Prevotellaceae bacterium]